MKRLLPQPTQKRKNQSGFITGEFIFAMVLAAGISTVLFAVTYTLSIIEITQYISFSSARALIAADESIDDQVLSSETKYKTLINHKHLKGLFFGDGSLFALSADPDIRTGAEGAQDFSDSYRDSQTSPLRFAYSGVRVELTPKIMNLKIAFLGRTSETGEAKEFSTRLTTLLTREPSAKECREKFIQQRYEAIGRMTDRFKEYGRIGQRDYVPLEDNGC